MLTYFHRINYANRFIIAEIYQKIVDKPLRVLVGLDIERDMFNRIREVDYHTLINRLKKEGNQSVTNCNHLKMQSAEGKFYKTDVADVEQIFRLIQSIPSPKAELFKMWLAEVARERLDEMDDPEQGIDRKLQQISEMATDTRMLAGAELYDFARIVYKMSKISVSLEKPGSQSIVDDLSQLHASQGKQNVAKVVPVSIMIVIPRKSGLCCLSGMIY